MTSASDHHVWFSAPFQTRLYCLLIVSQVPVCGSAVRWVIVGNDERNKTLNTWLFPYSHKELDIVSLDTIQHVADSVFIFRLPFFFPRSGWWIPFFVEKNHVCVSWIGSIYYWERLRCKLSLTRIKYHHISNYCSISQKGHRFALPRTWLDWGNLGHDVKNKSEFFGESVPTLYLYLRILLKQHLFLLFFRSLGKSSLTTSQQI